jgi:phage FluMu gp28-like protein
MNENPAMASKENEMKAAVAIQIWGDAIKLVSTMNPNIILSSQGIERIVN